ncbi:MAG: DUF1501 domain-containing protein [Myxococcota bacterium]|nr:DUF1501 domain-containing protein [Myxococcota bacterium]
MLNRRNFLGSLAAGGAVLGLSGLGLAESMRPDRKFLFVFADGGWDPLCVFAPKFNAANIQMEPGTRAYRIAGHELVHHASRPQVRDYFERYASDTAIINGLSTRSVSHEVCSVVATTGSTRGNTPDWSSLVAQGGNATYSIPSLVLGGPSFPGQLEVLVSRSGEYLEHLVNIGFPNPLDDDEDEVPRLSAFGNRLDRFVRQRAKHRRQTAESQLGRRLSGDIEASVGRLQRLKSVSGDINLAVDDLNTQVDSAIQALSLGLSRSVSIVSEGGFGWDTHEDNANQTPLFNGLFTELSRLMAALKNTPGQSGQMLIEETTVVVYSEMGRTPLYNETGGRDHWPYTSVMLMGAGIQGGQTVGQFDDQFTGVGFDPRTGRPSTSELGVPAVDLGATLVHLAGLNPDQDVPNGRVLHTLLT